MVGSKLFGVAAFIGIHAMIYWSQSRKPSQGAKIRDGGTERSTRKQKLSEDDLVSTRGTKRMKREEAFVVESSGFAIGNWKRDKLSAWRARSAVLYREKVKRKGKRFAMNTMCTELSSSAIASTSNTVTNRSTIWKKVRIWVRAVMWGKRMRKVVRNLRTITWRMWDVPRNKFVCWMENIGRKFSEQRSAIIYELKFALFVIFGIILLTNYVTRCMLRGLRSKYVELVKQNGRMICAVAVIVMHVACIVAFTICKIELSIQKMANVKYLKDSFEFVDLRIV